LNHLDDFNPIMQQEEQLWAMYPEFADADRYPLIGRYEAYNGTIAVEEN
jgi:hypothetical protein